MATEGVPTPTGGEPQLIVIFKSDIQARVTPKGISALSADVSSVQSILERHDASLRLLFGRTEQRLHKQQSEVASFASSAGGSDPGLPDLASFYHVQAPSDKLDRLAEQLLAADEVEAAYVKQPTPPPIFTQEKLKFTTTEAPAITPNFRNRQGYLGPAPEGIDAIPFAHDRVGGQGEGIRVVDCEHGWRFTHEDIGENLGGLLFGVNDLVVNVEHGTAVAGILGGDRNDFGVTGIVPRAIFSASSWSQQPSSEAIKAAADKLRPGDLILLEGHRQGPTGNYIPIEWWPDDFAATQYAVAKGIIVVAAAGNGDQNLDDPVYDTPYPGFPPWWTNPFNAANPSSGAVLVGAGAPPPGTHEIDFGPDRSRLSFSNYGQRVDSQGWGYGVTTTGYGDLQWVPDSPDLWYTDSFNGTSSASPIVIGALAAVSGVLKDFGRQPLTSHRARELLRSTGSPQQDGPNAPTSQRIGNRPNLRQMIPAALGTA